MNVSDCNSAPRILYPIAQVIHALSMLLIGLCTYFQWEQYSWVPLACTMVIVFVRAAGTLPVTEILLSELYPTKIRAQGFALTEATYHCITCFHAKLFPSIKNSIGFFGISIIYASFGILSALWGALTIPDNRGKSLVKVQELYAKEKVKNKV